MNFRMGLDKLKAIPISGEKCPIKLDANESAFNLPIAVRKKLMERLEASSFNRYTDTGYMEIELKKKIANDLEVSVENIAIGSGSSQLLQAACYIFGGDGRKVIFPKPSYSMYVVFCKLADARAIAVDSEDDFSLAPDKILTAAKREEASLIILSNPNNPAGNKIPLVSIQKIVENADCPVIVDEAYIEFGGESILTLPFKYPNLIVMRTFSKAYGLAAARVGYTVASKEIVEAVEKFLLPFHMSALSLIMADTVYENKDEFKGIISATIAERERVSFELTSMKGIHVFPSSANFLLIKVKEATALVAELATNGIYVQGYNLPRLDEHIRITIGTPEENNALLATIRKFNSHLFEQGLHV